MAQHPGLLDLEREGERELGVVVNLQFLDGKRECGTKRREEGACRWSLISLRIEAEDPVAGAVINGGILEMLGASHFDFFDVHLHTIARMLAIEERQLPRTPLGLTSLLVVVGMRSLLQLARDSSAVEGPFLNKIFQGSFT